MPAYIQGNLAVQQEVKPKVKIKETTRIVYRNKSLTVLEKLLYLFTVIIFVVVAGVIVWRYAQIYQMNTQMQQMQQEIHKIQAENSALKQDIEKLQSIDRLKEQAKKLGLRPTEDKQINHVANKPSQAEGSNKVAMNP